MSELTRDIERRLIAEGVPPMEIPRIFAAGFTGTVRKLPRDRRAKMILNLIADLWRDYANEDSGTF